MTLLRRVARVHCLDGDTLLGGLVAYLCVEFDESPSVETLIYKVAVVHRLPDVRQVFQDEDQVINRLGVLHNLA